MCFCAGGWGAPMGVYGGVWDPYGRGVGVRFRARASGPRSGRPTADPRYDPYADRLMKWGDRYWLTNPKTFPNHWGRGNRCFLGRISRTNIRSQTSSLLSAVLRFMKYLQVKILKGQSEAAGMTMILSRITVVDVGIIGSVGSSPTTSTKICLNHCVLVLSLTFSIMVWVREESVLLNV
jgi:hypothetical protein